MWRVARGAWRVLPTTNIRDDSSHERGLRVNVAMKAFDREPLNIPRATYSTLLRLDAHCPVRVPRAVRSFE